MGGNPVEMIKSARDKYEKLMYKNNCLFENQDTFSNIVVEN